MNLCTLPLQCLPQQSRNALPPKLGEGGRRPSSQTPLSFCLPTGATAKAMLANNCSELKSQCNIAIDRLTVLLMNTSREEVSADPVPGGTLVFWGAP